MEVQDLFVRDNEEEVDRNGDADEEGDVVYGWLFSFVFAASQSPLIFVVVDVGGGLDLYFVGEAVLGGDSIVGSVVTFWGRDDPPPFEELGCDNSFSYRPELFI